YQVAEGNLAIDQAKSMLTGYENLGYAKVDLNREKRQGFPEIIYGEGKTVEQIVSILEVIQSKDNNVLITRISKNKAEEILKLHPEFVYHSGAKLLYWAPKKQVTSDENNKNYIAVVCAGT